MNRFAYYMSGYALKAFTGFTKTRMTIHGKENIPEGDIIYTANHFTRIETVFLPYHIHAITKKPVWSLAAAELFQGSLKGLLEAMGAVSTRDPQRDFLIVKGLLSGRSECIIFPEGIMVKNKKILVDEGFRIYQDGAFQRPHTGAATLALRTEFYRERMRRMQTRNPREFQRLVALYEIESPETVLSKETFIVPVNITYYPVRAKENMLSRMARNMVEDPSPRVMDELMTEGTMIFAGVDVDIRFGAPVSVRSFFFNGFVESDLTSRRAVEFSPRLSSSHIMRQGALELMNRYMSQVYTMTTLNYDHIFASILKYLPDNDQGIDPYDFRSRAFLATAACSMELHCHFHKSIYSNQIHILIDDRFNRYEDFMRLAYETGMVSLINGKIHKDQSRFSSPTEFHSARMENPVSVIANEVEPLVKLQEYFRELAQLSRETVAHRVGEHIRQKHLESFQSDLVRTSSSSGSGRLSASGRPVLLTGRQGGVGIVLIHDYLSSPAEMAALARYLHWQGITVYVPRLQGHGTSPEDLATSSFEEWVESAEEGLVMVRHLCRHIAVGGVGVGGIIALYLQARAGDSRAFFTLSCPLRMKDFSPAYVQSSGSWYRMIKNGRRDKTEKTNKKGAGATEKAWAYTVNPALGMKQVERLLDQVTPLIETVQVPALIMRPRENPMVDVQAGEKLFQRIGSRHKRFYQFDFKGHGLPRGEDEAMGEQVFEAITRFVTSMTAPKNDLPKGSDSMIAYLTGAEEVRNDTSPAL